MKYKVCSMMIDAPLHVYSD